VTPEEAARFSEDDEDPSVVFAALDAGTKGLTARVERGPEDYGTPEEDGLPETWAAD